MEKKLLKSREDFIKWQNYCKKVAYEYVKFVAEDEDEPKEYPCLMISHEEQWGSYLYNLHYCFVYSSDIVA